MEINDLSILWHMLLPCPICGGRARLIRYDIGGITQYVVECCDSTNDGNIPCLIAVWGAKTPEEAIEHWNRRAENTDLKPCPFCGGKAKLVFHEYSKNPLIDEYVYDVRCQNKKCRAATITDSDPKKVIELWNRRYNSKQEAE